MLVFPVLRTVSLWLWSALLRSGWHMPNHLKRSSPPCILNLGECFRSCNSVSHLRSELLVFLLVNTHTFKLKWRFILNLFFKMSYTHAKVYFEYVTLDFNKGFQSDLPLDISTRALLSQVWVYNWGLWLPYPRMFK